MALVGAGVGLVLGLLLTADWAPGNEYETGRRVGFVCRYVVLGAIGFTLAGRLLDQHRSESSLSAGLLIGLAVVVLLAVLPPLSRTAPPSASGTTSRRTSWTAASRRVLDRYP